MEKQTVVLRNLCVGYRNPGGTRTVVSEIQASLYSDELTCLIGENGVGKSTLLRTLSAFQPILSGEVSVNGKSLSKYSSHELARLVSVVLTEKPTVEHLRVWEVVGLGCSPYTGFWGTLSVEDKKIVNESIQQVGIEKLKDRMFGNLSDGERQKVMIAKSLAQQTPIMFLDEPTAFLDFPSKVEILQMLRMLAHTFHKTILVSTHDVELALQLADRLWLLETKGLSVGSPRELAEQGALSRFITRPGITFDPLSMTIQAKV